MLTPYGISFCQLDWDFDLKSPDQNEKRSEQSTLSSNAAKCTTTNSRSNLTPTKRHKEHCNAKSHATDWTSKQNTGTKMRSKFRTPSTTVNLAYFHSLGPLAPQCKPQWPPWIAFMLWHEVRELLEHSTPTSQHSTPSSGGYSFIAVMPVNEPNKVFFNLNK